MVPLAPRTFDLLVTLVERDGHLLTKEELLERVWPRAVVEENALQAQISALRKILGADAIATVPRSGYRFALGVVRSVGSSSGPLSPRHNLPQPSTSFVGRDKEMTQVRLLLGRTRLLTLTGAGGCGKTRLAIQTAQGLLESYQDGTWFVDLAALSDPGLVAPAVAAALELREQRGKTLVQTIARHLSATRPLLVLDNAEHLAAAVAELVDELLRRCERVVFMVTSRQRLGLAGELAYRVPSLSVPDPGSDATPQRLATFESVQLFVDRVRLHRPHFAVTAEAAPAIAWICRQLDGIPLAIELAAPRLRSMPVEEVQRRLDQRFALLTTGSRTALHRQRTLRAMIDWSYDLLTPAEQALLGRASVFAGGWTLDAAERTCVDEGEDPSSTLDLLASLADRNLISADEHDGTSRYRMLQTVRQYARDRLNEAGAAAAWQDRHLAYYLAVAEEAAPMLKAADPWPWVDGLGLEHDNMRAALAWCSVRGREEVEGLRLANALWMFWWYRGHFGEGLAVLVGLIEATRAGEESAARAQALHAAGEFADALSDFVAAQSFHEQSLAIRRKLGDLDLVAQSFNGLGNVVQRRGDLAAALAFHQEVLAIWRQLGKRKGVSGALNNLGNVAYAMSDHVSARAYHEESLAIRRELGDRWGTATSLFNLSAVARDQGEHAEAMAKCEEALALYRELGERRGAAYCLAQIGFVAIEMADLRSSEAKLRECLPQLVELGDQWAMSSVISGLGDTCAPVNGPRAARLWGAVERLREAIESPRAAADQERHERRVKEARVALADAAAFDRAWQEGRAMNLDQVVQFALDADGVAKDATA